MRSVVELFKQALTEQRGMREREQVVRSLDDLNVAFGKQLGENGRNAPGWNAAAIAGPHLDGIVSALIASMPGSVVVT